MHSLFGHKSSEWRNALLMRLIGNDPITLLMAASLTVARLSVITTESAKRPACFPSGEDSSTVTRLGWPARTIWLVIMARIICDRPPFRASLCTTSAGRVFAEMRSEFGNSARTTSPRFKSSPKAWLLQPRNRHKHPSPAGSTHRQTTSGWPEAPPPVPGQWRSL